MSGPRVYGTFLDGDGVRHDLSGVIDGTFSRKKGGWDSITTCGKYSSDEPDTNPDNYVTCLKCIVTVRTVRPRDVTTDDDPVIIDEAQTFTPTQLQNLIDTVGNTVKAGATRGNGGTR